jgi:hypothetical protein
MFCSSIYQDVIRIYFSMATLHNGFTYSSRETTGKVATSKSYHDFIVHMLVN